MNLESFFRSVSTYAKYFFVSQFLLASTLTSNTAGGPTTGFDKDFERPTDKEETVEKTREEVIKDYKKDIPESVKGLHVPTSLGQVTSDFGSRNIGHKTDFHFGVDVAPVLNNESPQDRNVYAPEEGVVDEVGHNSSAGNYVKVSHPVDSGSLQSIICHLEDYNVEVGDSVQSLEKIAMFGNTGMSTGDHLHWGVKAKGNHFATSKHGNFINPKNIVYSDYNELEVNSIVGFDAIQPLKERFPDYYAKLKDSHQNLLYAGSENPNNSLDDKIKDSDGKDKSKDVSEKSYRIQIAASKKPKLDYFESKYGSDIQEHLMDVDGETYYKYTVGAGSGNDYNNMKDAMKNKKRDQAVLVFKSKENSKKPIRSVWG